MGAAVSALAVAGLGARAASANDAEFSGTFETRTAFGFSGSQLQKSEFLLTPEVYFSLSSKTSVTIIGRLRGDMKDQLEPGSPLDHNRSDVAGRLTLGDNLDAEIREAYIDTQIGNSYLRLGKQQIVWGQADGLKVLDVLNPQSFREFILDDFDDSRIPLWSVNAEVPVGDLTLQLVWIPDTTYADVPEAGALYAFTSPLIAPQAPPGVPVHFAPLDKPSNAFSDSDVCVKLSAFISGWDLSLNYAYHHGDAPVVRRTLSQGSITIDQRYERSHLIGGTFSNVFGDFTLRGELGYSTDKWYSVVDPADTDGVARSDEFAYVLGLDYGGFTDWFISAQVFQSYLTDSPFGLVRPATDTNFTLLIQRDFMNESLRSKVLLIQSVTGNDGLLQFSLDYDWKSNVTLNVGTDIFYGNKAGLFGQFRDTDRITVGLEVSF